MIAERTGYTQAGKKVEVQIGETTQVTLLMQAIDIPEETYYRAVTRTSHIHAGHAMLTWPVHDIAYVNQSTVNALLCDACQFVLHFEKAPKQVLTQAIWPAGTGGTNADVWLAHYKNRTGASASYAADYSFYIKSRGAQNWSADTLQKWRGWDRMHVHVHGGLTTVNVEHKLELWVTFAYNGYLADGYSALPPP